MLFNAVLIGITAAFGAVALSALLMALQIRHTLANPLHQQIHHDHQRIRAIEDNPDLYRQSVAARAHLIHTRRTALQYTGTEAA